MHQPCEPLPALGLQGFSLGQSIVGTWVNSRLAVTSPYELNIVLAFDPGDDPEHAADVAGKAESEVEKMFSDKCFDQTTDKWTDIHLKSCMAISEDDLSVRQAKMFLQWRLEHMSFKSDDEQPVPMNLQG